MNLVDIEKWKAESENERKEKDMFLGSGHPQSPIQLGDLQKFNGLNYYPLDPAYRFELELHEHTEKETLKVMDSKNMERKFIRWGEFRFKIGDKNCTLQAYKSDPMEDRLFVPFRDTTSSKDTYSAGRYMDLDRNIHLTSEGKWIFDFNAAYNPWCAYNEAYACPFVLPENWLDVSILAGEKNY